MIGRNDIIDRAFTAIQLAVDRTNNDTNFLPGYTFNFIKDLPTIDTHGFVFGSPSTFIALTTIITTITYPMCVLIGIPSTQVR
jgi:hypothetical protein